MDNQKTKSYGLSYFCLFATIFALVVVILGAYTRLTDAGLGCPDWPGCYGQLSVPQTQGAIAKAEQAFPGAVVEQAKAWAEMVHRYFAGTLGIGVLVIFLWSIKRRKIAGQPLILPALLLLMIIFQAVLGMWTVTWKLLPTIVMGHLLGGFTVLTLLWIMVLKTSGYDLHADSTTAARFKPWALWGLLILIFQIILGGWTSANYAGISCPDFPYCQGNLIPPMNFKEAFDILHPIGVNYDGGVMDNVSRMTINTMHRMWAIVTAAYLACLALALVLKSKTFRLQTLGMLLVVVLMMQVGLGIFNVVWLLPLAVAVAHNAVAALLLLVVATLVYGLYSSERNVVGE